MLIYIYICMYIYIFIYIHMICIAISHARLLTPLFSWHDVNAETMHSTCMSMSVHVYSL